MTAAHVLYDAALRDGRASLTAHDASGRAWPLALDRWLAPAHDVDERVLERAAGPVLDVGCGPGRHARALAARGVPVLGLDLSRAAVHVARAAGVPVHRGDVFGPVPGSGTWRTALLLDGNVGIGGDPVVLLRRVATLLAPGGRILCEGDPPGLGLAVAAVRLGDGRVLSDPFAWARVGADALPRVATDAGLHVVATWDDQGRWFAELGRRAEGES